MKRVLLGTGILTIALLSGSAFADHGRGHDRDHDGWHNRDRAHVQHVADHDKRPPGWDHGQKRGWGDHNVPPGQAKKQAIEHHEARERREHEWRQRERARRAHELRESREARERRLRESREARERRAQAWRERERRERERRAEWLRTHHHGVTPAGTPTTTTPAPTGSVAAKRPLSLPVGHGAAQPRLAGQPAPQ
jgi:hypothetical protein